MSERMDLRERSLEWRTWKRPRKDLTVRQERRRKERDSLMRSRVCGVGGEEAAAGGIGWWGCKDGVGNMEMEGV